jgi:hypothetical protein
MQKSITLIPLCLLLITLGCTSAFSQTNENQKISSIMDDKISQLNTALTRIIDRQENLRSSVTGLEEKLTLFSDRIDIQETEIANNLLGEIEAMKTKTSTEIASIQQSLVALNDLTTEIGEIRSAQEESNAELKDAIELVEKNMETLMQERVERQRKNAFTVLEDDAGFAKLVSREEITRVALTIPNKEQCSEIGEWLIENVPMRDANRFYVMNNDEYAVCKNMNGSWSTLPVNASQKSHVVYEKS